LPATISCLSSPDNDATAQNVQRASRHAAVFKSVAEMTRLALYIARSDRNRLTAISRRLRTRQSSPTCIEFGFRQRANNAQADHGFLVRDFNALRLLSDDRSVRPHGRGGRLCALSAGRHDPVSEGARAGHPAGPNCREVAGSVRRFDAEKGAECASLRLSGRAIIRPGARGEGGVRDEERPVFHPDRDA
jgi:hypothetical protein